MISNIKLKEAKSITLIYHLNVNSEMLQHLKAAKQDTKVSFSEIAPFQKTESQTACIKLKREFTIESEHYPLDDFKLSLPGYHFEGWKIVRDGHNLIPRGQSPLPAALYAGESSSIHKTGISSPEFLWKVGDHFTPTSNYYDLYAQWSPINYEVKLVARTVYGVNLNLTLPTGTRTIEEGFQIDLQPQISGYEFIGWKFLDQQENWLCRNKRCIIPAGIGSVTLIALFDETS